MLAAIRNNYSLVAVLLLKRGADPKVGDGRGLLPLHYAAVQGMIAVVKALIAGGADVNAKTWDSETPLSAAHVDISKHHSHKRCERAIQILSENGGID